MEAEPEALRRFADDTGAKLETLEGIRFVDYRRETDFFRERALYYLQLDDLQEVAAASASARSGAPAAQPDVHQARRRARPALDVSISRRSTRAARCSG